jgi:hypothetical protein
MQARADHLVHGLHVGSDELAYGVDRHGGRRKIKKG